jgi:hypothetical protein
LNVRVRSVDTGICLNAKRSTVVLTLWSESSDTVRGRLEHLTSGTTSYFQGNATLEAFANEIGLRGEPPPRG